MSADPVLRDEHLPVVLVVEDEPLLRMHAVDLLDAAGFAAIDASDADQAIAILERRSDVDVLFSDIDMPDGLEGLRLAVTIRRRWPPIAIILTSGNHEAADMALPHRATFLPKPYEDHHVVSEVRRLVA